MLAVLILVAFLIGSSRQAAAVHVIHVRQNGTSDHSCWTGSEKSPCDSLQFALLGLQSHFKDTTILVHGPANYPLLANATVIRGASNVKISGTGDAIIDCQSGAGLVFINSLNILLSNLTLNGCGKVLSGDTTVAAGLLFQTCQHITVDNVTISDSRGVGTILQNTSGLVQIRHSVFIGGHSTSLSAGGGLWIALDSPLISDYNISNCHFENNSNSAELSSSRGGGMMVSLLHANVTSFSMLSCNFTNNSAQYGGGLYMQLDSSTTSVSINNSSFGTNQALAAGAAIFITAPLPLPGTLLPRCITIAASTFESNRLPVSQNVTTGIGSVYSDGVSLCLAQMVRFTKNQATALVMSGAHLMVTESSQVVFAHNVGHNGGALALLDSARMTVSGNSSLNFTHNKAQLKGGAIYSSYYSYAESVGNMFCLVQYVNASVHPNDWNVSIVFRENTANRQSNAIYTPSLYSCVWSTNNMISITRTFCWRGWKYLPDTNCSQHIETAPAYYRVLESQQSSGPIVINTYPGRSKELPLHFFNDESKDVTSTTAFNSILSNDNDAYVSEYTTSNKVTMYGKPGTSAILTLGTLRPRVLKTELEVIFWVCPPGFTSANTTSSKYGCVCKGDYDNTVICKEETMNSFLKWGQILTYDKFSEEVLGAAWRVFTPPAHLGKRIPGYFQLPNDSFLLNDFMCQNLSRTGFLCEECINGTSSPVYSYDYSCVNCSSEDVRINWLWFLLLETVPVTLLFLVVTVFNISATSGPLNAFVFYSQVISNPSIADNFAAQLSYVFKDSPWIAKLILSIFIFPYGIWNLDCLPTRSLISPFCIGENMTAVETFTINYLIGAVYPLLLIVFLFVCIELHARDFRPLVCLWRYFGCFLRWRRNWNIRTSVIDAFATFMLLSYTKFCFLSLFLLVPMNTYNSAGETVGPARLYFDPSVIYGGPKHIPYMVLSILILIFVVILPPIFLLLYPFAIFQRMLACCRVRGNAVRTYVEAFQGCYKDGTNGTYDCRYFASVYFGLRIVAFSSIVLSYDRTIQRFIQMLLVYFAVMSFSFIRPYKREIFNRLDILILTIMGIVTTFGFFNAVISNNFVVINVAMMVTVIIPLGYFIGLVCYRTGTAIKHSCRRRRGYETISDDSRVDDVSDRDSSNSSRLQSYDRVSVNSSRGACIPPSMIPTRDYITK